LVSVKTVTIHITSPDYRLLADVIKTIADYATSHPDVVFEIGVTKPVEVK